jgi:hypothetical protein
MREKGRSATNKRTNLIDFDGHKLRFLTIARSFVVGLLTLGAFANNCPESSSGSGYLETIWETTILLMEEHHEA